MVKELLTEEQYEKLYDFVLAPSQKYKTSMTEKRFKRFLDLVSKKVRWSGEVVGQAVFSGKQIVFKEEDEMKATTVDEINRALTTAAEADAAEVEESPFPIPFEELPEEPEWDEGCDPGPPPEENGGEF